MLHQQASVSSLVTGTYFVRKIYAIEKFITHLSINARPEAHWQQTSVLPRLGRRANHAHKLQISAFKAAESPTGAAEERRDGLWVL